MSLLHPGRAAATADQGPEDSVDAPEVCAYCQTPMDEDQEWCLECGAARTLIHRAPDWRVPVVVIGAVVVLALAGLAIALINLSATANRSAAVAASTPAATTSVTTPTRTVSRRTTTTPVTATATSATAGATTPASPIASWPVGLSGWTVVLAEGRDEASAETLAKQLAARGFSVGVLNSSDHPSMTAGLWIVFSHRYPSSSDAQTEEAKLVAAGLSVVGVREVAPPGGL